MFDRLIVARLVALICLFTLTHTACGQNAKAKEEAARKKKAAEANTAWKKNGWPKLKKFCIECHNADTQEAEVDLSLLEHLDSSDPASSSMMRVLEMVRFGAMPPDDAELPTETERKALVAALDNALYSVTCDLRPRAGKVTARRLNRAEYNNSIRDLFGMDLRPADAFPSDEVGAGFDNNGDVLSLSPMMIEKYLAAAESVSQKVLVDWDEIPKLDIEIPSDRMYVHGKTKTGGFNGIFLDPDAFAWVTVEIPIKGEYRFRVRGGNSERDKSKTNVAIYDRDGVLVGLDDLKYYGGGGESERFEFRLNLEPGKHRFVMEPIEDDEIDLKVGETRSERFDKLDPQIIKDATKRRAKPLTPDDDLDASRYPFMFRKVEVVGPKKIPDDLLPPKQYELLRRMADRRDGRWHNVESAAIESLKPIMRLAFREPVQTKDVKPYARLVEDACQRGDSYYRGMQIAISAILVSPRFLFRVETPPDGWKPKKGETDVQLTQYQLATRLSYFLWSSTPDNQLLNEAQHNRLKGNGLEYNVRRMLSDKRSESLANQFAAQWLGLRNLAEHEADTEETFKGFDPKLMDSMSRETRMLFSHVVRENKPVGELLTADYTFINRDLAKHYKIDFDSDSDEFVRVSLKGTPRRGLLSHGSMLTLTSYATRTSPVQRGKWILENILGTPPPDPPANVPDLETKSADENASLRDQLKLHRDSPTCSSCHKVMDQLGFGLEQFDAIGRYRKMEGNLPVDASGVLPGGRKFDGVAELSEVLSKTERKAFAKTMVERLLTFAIGRELSPNDRCVVDEIVQKAEKKDYRMVDLILGVVQSRPFGYYEIGE